MFLKRLLGKEKLDPHGIFISLIVPKLMYGKRMVVLEDFSYTLKVDGFVTKKN